MPYFYKIVSSAIVQIVNVSFLFRHVFELHSRDQICTYFSNWNCWADLKLFMLFNNKKRPTRPTSYI